MIPLWRRIFTNLGAVLVADAFLIAMHASPWWAIMAAVGISIFNNCVYDTIEQVSKERHATQTTSPTDRT